MMGTTTQHSRPNLGIDTIPIMTHKHDQDINNQVPTLFLCLSHGGHVSERYRIGERITIVFAEPLISARLLLCHLTNLKFISYNRASGMHNSTQLDIQIDWISLPRVKELVYPNHFFRCKNDFLPHSSLRIRHHLYCKVAKLSPKPAVSWMN